MKVLGAKPQLLIAYKAGSNAVGDEREVEQVPAAKIEEWLKENPPSSVISLAYGTMFPQFWVGFPADGEVARVGNGVHIAFNAKNKEMVDEFHKVALAHGGVDNGSPGPRPQYSEKYYGAFVLDPDGNKLEATFIDMGMFGTCTVV